MIEFIVSTPLIRWLVLAAVFTMVVAGAVLGLNFFERRIRTRVELREIAGPSIVQGSTATLHERNDGVWARLVASIERSGLSLDDSKTDLLRERLRAAGFEAPIAPRLYTLIRLALMVVLPSTFVVYTLMTGQELSFVRLYLVGSIMAAAGLFIPALIVRIRADRRQEAITNGFPDCLDLMLIAVEAGLGLESAIDRVAREMASSHPLVSRLLTRTTLRLRAGATREDALRAMADEAGVDEVRSFSTLLIQSDRLGTSIGSTLRVYASEMRERRRMRAEEKAHRLPVLISIPLVVCMLPSMIGVLMLPAVIRIIRDIFPTISGG